MDGQAAFNIITPQPFSLSRHSDSDKQRLRGFIMDENIRKCEFSLSNFYSDYNEAADFWRVRTQKSRRGTRNLFNSRTGESHRGVETLCTFWFRVLTSHDPNFEAVPLGLDELGQALTSEQLFVVEQILQYQKTHIHFKDKLLTVLRSCAAFGAVVVEQPWVQRPVVGMRDFEATDYVLSPLIRTYFDTTRSHIDDSHYMANADYVTNFHLLDMAMNDTESWDVDAVQESIKTGNTNSRSNLMAWGHIQERKTRAGYTDNEDSLNELVNYHGRLSREIVESDLLVDLWESEGDQNLSPYHCDFTTRILNGDKVVSLFPTAYGDWHERFVTATYKRFEGEPIGYSVPKIGKKMQLSMDFMTSNASDMSTMSLFNMWLVNMTSGIKQNQLGIKPLNMIEVEDVNNSIKPLSPDVNAISYAINLINTLKSDFRATTGASDTLQAEATAGSATEASISQNEAVRQQSVVAEILGESLMRDHLETSHLNNINYLDAPIWVALSGADKPQYGQYNRLNIPKNIGIKLKITSDKDYRPERINRLIQAFQLLSSIRQMIPSSINAIRPMVTEIFRELGIDPRILNNPVPMQDQLEMIAAKNRGGASGSPSAAGNELSGEIAGAQSGDTNLQTPMGTVGASANPIIPPEANV